MRSAVASTGVGRPASSSDVPTYPTARSQAPIRRERPTPAHRRRLLPGQLRIAQWHPPHVHRWYRAGRAQPITREHRADRDRSGRAAGRPSPGHRRPLRVTADRSDGRATATSAAAIVMHVPGRGLRARCHASSTIVAHASGGVTRRYRTMALGPQGPAGARESPRSAAG